MPNPRPSSLVARLLLAHRRLTSGWALLGYAIALLTATHWPGQFRTETTLGGIALDHIVHGLLFAPLTLLLAGFLAQRRVDSPWRRWRLAITPAVLVVAAALDEWTQSVPGIGRTTSLNDWIGDLIGIALVTVVLAVLELVRRNARC